MTDKDRILELRSKGKTYREIRTITGFGLGKICYWCGNGQKLKNNKRTKLRREKTKEWVNDLKTKLKCKVCGESRWWVLDFHHRDPSNKEASVSKLMRNASKEVVVKEIKKCDILCANCHRDLHYNEV